MKIAVIDMGTNTFHLLVAELIDDGYSIIHKERLPVKVGEKGINKDEIAPAAWERALEALKAFKKTAQQLEAQQIFATATSAMRNARNGAQLAKEIKEQTGIEVNIISGAREAELILKGVRKALSLGQEKSLIMDIGGGSVEFIIANQKQTFWMQSFEIGGQRLVEKFHHNDPITLAEIEDIKRFLRQELVPLAAQCKVHAPKTLVGCSGTFDTLSDIYQAKNNLLPNQEETEPPFPLEAFKAIHQELTTKVRSERLEIPGMIEMRVDMIVVASILIDFLVDSFHLSATRVSTYALKEGVLINTIESVQNSDRS